jgi:hypothetical protein
LAGSGPSGSNRKTHQRQKNLFFYFWGDFGGGGGIFTVLYPTVLHLPPHQIPHFPHFVFHRNFGKKELVCKDFWENFTKLPASFVKTYINNTCAKKATLRLKIPWQCEDFYCI